VVEHWGHNHQNMGSNPGRDGPMLYELLMLILAPIAPTSLRLKMLL